MKSLSTAITRAILLVAILALVGCGGGGGVGSGSQGPAQPAGDVTIQGRVIAATDVDGLVRLSELVTFEVAGLEPPPPPPPPPS